MNFTHVRVPKDLLKRLAPKAKASGRSVTKYIEQLIIKDLRGDK